VHEHDMRHQSENCCRNHGAPCLDSPGAQALEKGRNSERADQGGSQAGGVDWSHGQDSDKKSTQQRKKWVTRGLGVAPVNSYKREQDVVAANKIRGREQAVQNEKSREKQRGWQTMGRHQGSNVEK